MILQGVHTKPDKFSNHYLNSVTEGRDEQDGSQTSSGESLYFCHCDINIAVKDKELLLRRLDTGTGKRILAHSAP